MGGALATRDTRVMEQCRDALKKWKVKHVQLAWEKYLTLTQRSPQLTRAQFFAVFGVLHPAVSDPDDDTKYLGLPLWFFTLFIDGHGGGGGSGSKGTTAKPANAAKMMMLQRSATSGKLLAGGGASGAAAGSPRSVASEPMTATVVTSPRRSLRHHHQHVDLDAPKAPVTVNAVHIFLALCMYCDGSLRQRCAACFTVFDEDGNEVLDQEELIDFLRAASQTMYRVGAMKRMPSLVVLRKCAEDIFATADTNDDGELDGGEFYEWARKSLSLGALMSQFDQTEAALAEAAAAEKAAEKLEKTKFLRVPRIEHSKQWSVGFLKQQTLTAKLSWDREQWLAKVESKRAAQVAKLQGLLGRAMVEESAQHDKEATRRAAQAAAQATAAAAAARAASEDGGVTDSHAKAAAVAAKAAAELAAQAAADVGQVKKADGEQQALSPKSKRAAAADVTKTLAARQVEVKTRLLMNMQQSVLEHARAASPPRQLQELEASEPQAALKRAQSAPALCRVTSAGGSSDAASVGSPPRTARDRRPRRLHGAAAKTVALFTQPGSVSERLRAAVSGIEGLLMPESEGEQVVAADEEEAAAAAVAEAKKPTVEVPRSPKQRSPSKVVQRAKQQEHQKQQEQQPAEVEAAPTKPSSPSLRAVAKVMVLQKVPLEQPQEAAAATAGPEVPETDDAVPPLRTTSNFVANLRRASVMAAASTQPPINAHLVATIKPKPTPKPQLQLPSPTPAHGGSRTPAVDAAAWRPPRSAHRRPRSASASTAEASALAEQQPGLQRRASTPLLGSSRLLRVVEGPDGNTVITTVAAPSTTSHSSLSRHERGLFRAAGHTRRQQRAQRRQSARDAGYAAANRVLQPWFDLANPSALPGAARRASTDAHSLTDEPYPRHEFEASSFQRNVHYTTVPPSAAAARDVQHHPDLHDTSAHHQHHQHQQRRRPQSAAPASRRRGLPRHAGNHSKVKDKAPVRGVVPLRASWKASPTAASRTHAAAATPSTVSSAVPVSMVASTVSEWSTRSSEPTHLDSASMLTPQGREGEHTGEAGEEEGVNPHHNRSRRRGSGTLSPELLRVHNQGALLRHTQSASTILTGGTMTRGERAAAMRRDLQERRAAAKQLAAERARIAERASIARARRYNAPTRRRSDKHSRLRVNTQGRQGMASNVQYPTQSHWEFGFNVARQTEAAATARRDGDVITGVDDLDGPPTVEDMQRLYEWLNPDDKRMRSPVAAAKAAPRASSLSNATSNNNSNSNTLAAKWGRVKGSLTGDDVNQGMPRMTPVAMQLKELLPHQLAQTPT